MARKIVICSDTHIAAHSKNSQRMNEALDAFKWAYEQALLHGCEYLVHCGDVFHYRDTIDMAAYYLTYQVVKEYYSKGIKTIFLVGNHDLFYRFNSDINSILPFESFGKVVSEPETFEVLGRKCDFMPYIEKMSPLSSYFEDRGGDVLFAHIALEGAILNSQSMKRKLLPEDIDLDNEEQEIDMVRMQDLSGKWQLCFLGHYHYPHVVKEDSPKIEYVGSTFQLSLGERGEDKRIIVLDMETLEYESVFNKISPEFMMFEDIEEIDFSQVKNKRVKIVADPNNLSEIKEVRQKLIENGSISVVVKNKSPELVNREIQKKVITDSSLWVLDHEKMIDRYVRLQASVSLDSKRLKEIGRLIIGNCQENPARLRRG